MSELSTPVGATSQSLRAGSVKVAAGLGFYGGTTFVFLTLAARVMGPSRYSDFAVFWGLVYGVGLGVSIPFEQEVSRRVSEARAHGGSGVGALRTAYRVGGCLLVVLAAAMAVIAPLVNRGHHTSSWALWLSCCAAFVGLNAAYISRGGLSGSRRFGRYAAQLGAEGAVRVVAAATLTAVAVGGTWPWAFSIPAAIAVSVAVTAPMVWRQPVDEHVAMRPMVASITAVVVSSTISQLLVNFGPVVVRLLSDDAEQALAGRFLAAALLARVPIFLFAAVQAVLMPALVAAVVRGDRSAFTTSLRRVLVPTLGLALLGVLICLSIGPQLLDVLGPDYRLPRSDLVLLATSMGLFLGTLVLQPAAIALRQHREAAVAWIASGLVFVAVCLLPVGPLRAVELALIAACGLAVLALGGLVRRALRGH